MRETIMDPNYTSELLNDRVKNVMRTVLDNAADRVLNGETSIEEFEKLSDIVRV